MRVSQEDLRAMYERLEKNRAKVKPQFVGHRPYEKSKEGLPPIPGGYAEAKLIPGHIDIKPNAALQNSPLLSGVKRNKYRNIKVEHDGMKFDSKHELKCWQNLKLREKAGEIHTLQRQVKYDLEVNRKKVGRFTADFAWMEKHGEYVVADAKSEITRKETAYRLRKKIFEAIFAPLTIREL